MPSFEITVADRSLRNARRRFTGDTLRDACGKAVVNERLVDELCNDDYGDGETYIQQIKDANGNTLPVPFAFAEVCIDDPDRRRAFADLILAARASSDTAVAAAAERLLTTLNVALDLGDAAP